MLFFRPEASQLLLCPGLAFRSYRDAVAVAAAVVDVAIGVDVRVGGRVAVSVGTGTFVAVGRVEAVALGTVVRVAVAGATVAVGVTAGVRVFGM